MKAEWFANVNGQEYGPYTWQQMLQMAAEGRVPPDLPVKRSTDKKWFAARQVPGLVTPAPAKPKAAAAPKAAPAAPAAKDESHLKRAKPLAAAASAPVPPPPAPPPLAPPPPPRAEGTADSPWPVIVSEASKGKGTGPAAPVGQAPAHVPPRKKGALVWVAVLASLAALVLVAGGIGMWVVWFRAPPPAAQTQSPVALAEEAATGEGGAVLAASRTAAAGSAPAKKKDREAESASGNGPTAAELAGQEKTVQSIGSWQSMAGVKSFGVSNASLQLTRVWRTDAAGAEGSGVGGPYVCVEVLISNRSSAPLVYKGWNTFGETGAILADENKGVLPLVPAAKTPDFKRLGRTSVPGKGSIKEVLVFTAPPRADQVLHLVLPYSAFYSNVRPPHRAIEVTPDMLGVDLAADSPGLATNSGEPPLAAETSKPTSTADAAPGKASEPAVAEKAKKADKPPSLRDMINSDPGPPARPDEMPDEKNKAPSKESPKGAKPDGKKPENPFEPKDE